MLAKPTIADAFAGYFAERDKPTKARPYTLKRSIVELLESYMDGYAYESLAKDEEAFWRRRWDKDEEANSFSRTFGPERIPEHIGTFLGWFIIRKVMGGPEISGAAGPETLELLEGIEAKGYVKDRPRLRRREGDRALCSRRAAARGEPDVAALRRDPQARAAAVDRGSRPGC